MFCELCKECSFVKHDENDELYCSVEKDHPIIKDGTCDHFLDIVITDPKEIVLVDYYRSLTPEQQADFKMFLKLRNEHPETMCRVLDLEEIFNESIEMMEDFETNGIDGRDADFAEFQTKIGKLEEYLSSKERKVDLALDEAGKIPPSMRRGVLSEDGIYNFLERYTEFKAGLNGKD